MYSASFQTITFSEIIDRISNLQNDLQELQDSVCERHFKDGEVLYKTTFYNESTGETLSAPLKKPRLKENAVPSIFPGCPTYLASSISSIRDPSKKRQQLEQIQIERSIIESLNSKQNYDSKTAFTNFNELKKIIKDYTFSSFWTIIEKNENILFIHLSVNDGIPTITYPILRIHIRISKRKSSNSVPNQRRRLLAGESLGDRKKPSELLRIMKRRAESHNIDSSLLFVLFNQAMPVPVQTILTSISPISSDKAADIADRILDINSTSISTIFSGSERNSSPMMELKSDMDLLRNEIKELRKEVADLRRSRSRISVSYKYLLCPLKISGQ
ncbi:hypothetical protein HNY73_015613 [Argiope bruennichi]|uniref:Uncharacterized protein n=1 Tax=Argiope bruennichi TaxID=94029 RepID=A0A8T0EY62_ARGBR|nr:hypothetical protein HNY73_015613 [Argiope bruennichi]